VVQCQLLVNIERHEPIFQAHLKRLSDSLKPWKSLAWNSKYEFVVTKKWRLFRKWTTFYGTPHGLSSLRSLPIHSSRFTRVTCTALTCHIN